MEKLKEKAIREIIDSSIKNFANGFELRHTSEVNNKDGIINAKKNNVFISELFNILLPYVPSSKLNRSATSCVIATPLPPYFLIVLNIL